jgi:hypothetical protein
MLHIHVLLVAPLGTSYTAEPGTNQHEGRVTVWKAAHHTVPPLLNVNVCFLIQFADGSWRHLATLQDFGDILYTPDGDTG